MLTNHRLGETVRVENKNVIAGAMIETLSANVKLGDGKITEAFDIYKSALNISTASCTDSRVCACCTNKQTETALEFINKQLLLIPNDPQLFSLQAQCYALLGDIRMLQHRALAETYVLKGHYAAALDRMQTALQNSNGNFYQLSSVEARLKQIQVLKAEEDKEK